MKAVDLGTARDTVVLKAQEAIAKWDRLMEHLDTPIPVSFTVVMRELKDAVYDLGEWQQTLRSR